ncbi:MAG: hypothetical protein BWY59_00135 [Verrucomicrobia bacterium ADurb.Bin345]|nr:MAG: hypothetical protein BWY59_00135 [Verrucomicrobia bacterium ADurb.Bin345]
MPELRLLARAGGFEERVQIELIELPGARHCHQFVRHLVGEQPHLRQRPVGIPQAWIFRGKGLLGSLLIGVRPVEDLLLDKLAGRERLEWRTGEVEIRLGGDGEKLGLRLREDAEVLVHVFQAGGILELLLLLGDRLLFALEQFLRRLAPGAEVVLVENDQVPFHRVEPLVLRLDVAGVVATEQILEGAEIDERLPCGDFARVAVGIARQVLPAVEIDVGFEIRLPRVLHGGLEGDHEHALGAELLGELVGGEGFAEAHLRVPQEARHRVHVLLPDGVEIGVGFLDGRALLGAHRKRLVVRAGEIPAGAQFGEDSLHVLERAAHPLQLRVFETFPDERGADLVVGEERAVVALGGFVELDGVVLDRGRLELLGDALLHVARGLPDFEQPGVRRVGDRVSVDARPRLRLGREDLLDGRLIHRRPHLRGFHQADRSSNPSGARFFR